MRVRGVETFSCSAPSRLVYPISILRLARFLAAGGYDIFHSHLFDPSVVGLSAARLANTRARVLTRHYSNYHTRINRPLHVGLDRWCTARAHHVIAVSNETAEHLVQIEGAPPGKVTAVHNGIDFERVKASRPNIRGALREELGLGETFTFLAAGRLHPEKGYEHLLKAVQRLRVAQRPFTVLIAGRGPLLDHYRGMASSLGVADHVRFLGFRDDLADLMVASDVFVLASVAESFGLVLAEALFLGIPILASRVGGIPEIVDDGIDGCLVPPGSPEALASAMGRFLSGSVNLPGRGEAAIRKVRLKFDFGQMLRAYEAVYARVLANG